MKTTYCLLYLALFGSFSVSAHPFSYECTNGKLYYQGLEEIGRNCITAIGTASSWATKPENVVSEAQARMHQNAEDTCAKTERESFFIAYKHMSAQPGVYAHYNGIFECK